MRKECPTCGSIYDIVEHPYPLRDKDSIECTVCNTTLVSWNGACVFTSKLLERKEHPLSTQKPGIRLQVTIEARPKNRTLIRFTLPSGDKKVMTGPHMPATQFGSIDAMYYPDQFVQIVHIGQRGGGIDRWEIPLDEVNQLAASGTSSLY